LSRLSRLLLLSILFVSMISLVRPAHAQIVMSLGWTSITAPMGGVVSNTVSLASTDGNPHTITLSLSGWGGLWWNYFSPNPVSVPPIGVVSSTLTIPIPGPGDICPGQSSPGPYYFQLTVQAMEGHHVRASQTLTVNILPVSYPLTVSVEPSKSSYIVGEMVTIAISSNQPAEYYLKVRKPDGTVWASAHGFLPTATFTKKATEPLGTYTVELLAYFCGVAQGSASFVVHPDTYDVTISLAGLPADVMTALMVDGNKAADMRGGDVRVLSYPIGTSHTFQVDQYVSGGTGYRYYCAANSWTAGAEGSNTFNYVTQVYLDVSTDPTGVTEVTPSGWYALGSSASVSSVPEDLEGSAGVKYRFGQWQVDGTGRAGNGFVVVMDAPHKVVAKYDTLYKLTVVSDYGNPTGDGYYKSGDTATFSVDSPVGIGIQQVFVEWRGDFTGKEPKGSITMDNPKTVTAVWTTSYFQLYIIVGAIAAVAVIAALLFWRRGRAGPPALKPPPPIPPSEVPETVEEPPAPSPDTETATKPAVSIALRCTNCGHGLEEGQVFCPECGQKQGD